MKNKKSIKKLCMFGLAVGSLLSSAASFQIHGTRELYASITNTLDSNVETATFEVTLKFVNDAGKMLSVLDENKWVDFFKANFEIFQYLTSNDGWTPSDQAKKTSVDPEEIKEINAIKNTESNSVKFKITVNYSFALSFDSSQALQVTPYYYMIQPNPDATIFPGYTLSNADSNGAVYVKLAKIKE